MTHQDTMSETYTVPQPFMPDITLLRDLGNVSYKMAANCGEPCQNVSHIGQVTDTDIDVWQTVVQDASFVTFPVIVTWGILAGFASVIVMSSRRHDSEHGFLQAYSVTCVLLLMCGAAVKLEDYIGHSNTYQYAYGYLTTVHSWFAYSALWILVVATLERHSIVARHSHLDNGQRCGQTQAGIVSGVVFCISLISSLPQLWAYETVEVYDYTTNQTLVISHVSDATNTPEYNTVYFWYVVTITVLLPYPMLLVKLVLITSGIKRSRKLLTKWPVKYGSGNVLHRKITEEIHLSQFFVINAALYLLLTGPFIMSNIIDHLNPQWQLPENQIYVGLHSIAEFLFYFHFTLPFPLLCSYNDTFRCSLLKITHCCTCKCSKQPPKRQFKYGPPKNQKVVTFLDPWLYTHASFFYYDLNCLHECNTFSDITNMMFHV